ncbi:MAG: hypothetical protein H7Y00_05155, partial [Fimbriimonadaceae bacterium]|nr:hypothetical protein [Chitinophagales bacterium]
MNNTDKQIYYRLIALWAVCEGVLGGIIHGFNLPISGIIVGGSAVIIISLIGFYIPQKGAILKATILVCIFKMMLSPHSPLPAYVAVFFQGITGEFFFLLLPSLLKVNPVKLFKVSCILFATLALVESGVQRIITLTLIYGKDFWVAVDAFMSGITGEDTITRYSYYIAGGYVLLHFIAGIIIGWVAGRIPERIMEWKKDFQFILFSGEQENIHDRVVGEDTNHGQYRKWKASFFIIWIILIVLFLQSAFNIGKPLVTEGTILNIIVRSVLILFTWYFLLSPLLIYFLKKMLTKQQGKSQSTVNEILLLIPSTQNLVKKSWQLSTDRKGLKRLNKFMKIVLVNALD